MLLVEIAEPTRIVVSLIEQKRRINATARKPTHNERNSILDRLPAEVVSRRLIVDGADHDVGITKRSIAQGLDWLGGVVNFWNSGPGRHLSRFVGGYRDFRSAPPT